MVIFAAADPDAGPVAGDSDPALLVGPSWVVGSVNATKTSSFLTIYNVIEILFVVPRRESSTPPPAGAAEALLGHPRAYAAHLRQHRKQVMASKNQVVPNLKNKYRLRVHCHPPRNYVFLRDKTSFEWQYLAHEGV
jgi:hypothetical protein